MLSLKFTVKFSNRTAQNQASLFNGVLTELGLERSVEINDVKKDLEASSNIELNISSWTKQDTPQ